MSNSRLTARTRRAGAAVLGTVLGMALVASGRPAVAQPVFPGRSMPSASGEFIDPPRGMRQVFSEAESAIDERRYGDAVLLLGDLLAEEEASPDDPLQGEDFFTDPRGDEELSGGSLRRRAETMIGALPEEGRRLYELRFGADAEAALRRATDGGGAEPLAAVSRRYFHTEAGSHATFLLGYRLMQAGRPLAAALVLERLHAAPATRRPFEPQLTAVLAAAWRAAGREERAAALVSELDGQRVEVDGQTRRMEESGDAPQWLVDSFAQSLAPAAARGRDTRLAGGGADRLGAGGGERPIRHPRWIVPTTSSSREERALEAFQKSMSGGGAWPMPAAAPLVVGDTVLTRTTEWVVAIDLVTGKRIWEYPWFSADPEFDDEGASLQPMPDDEGRQLLYQRVWNDLPYARISSDGQRAYLLDGLHEMDTGAMGGFGPLGFRGAESSDEGTNTLVALQLASEGKMAWTVSGAETEDPRLRGAFFLGPPLPVDGSLYVIAEIGGDTYLVCLDPASGELRWRQHLVASDAGGVVTDPIRRLAGATPAHADGVLVCPTSQGAVVAIDLYTRALRWGWRYDRTHPDPNRRNNRAEPDPAELMDRWYDPTPTIADGRVILTPPESDRLHCLDLVTGEPQWAKSRRTGGGSSAWRHVAGVRDGRVLLVGDNQLTALELATGDQAWPEWFTLPDGEAVAGSGLFGEDGYYFATSKGRILNVGLSDGQLRSAHSVDFPVGNLVASDGQIISLGVTGIAAAYGRDTLSRLVELRFDADPDDYWATVRRGQLLLEDGERHEALEFLQRAHAMRPEDEEVRVLLVDTLLAVLRDDPSAAERVGPLLDELAEMPDRRAEMMRLLADAALGNGRVEEAMRRVRDLAALASDPQRWYAGASLDAIRLEEEHEVTVDGWIAARVGEIRNAADEEAWQTLQEDLDEWSEELATAPGIAQRRFLRQFGRLGVSDAVRRDLTEQSLQDGSLLVAERLALEAIHQNPEAARPWHLLLARTYAEAGWTADARAALAAGEADGGPATEEELGGRTREQLRANLQGAGDSPDWPEHVEVSRESTDRAREASVQMLEIETRNGHQWQGWQVLHSGQGVLQLQDPFGRSAGQVRLEGTSTSGSGVHQAFFDSGLLLVVLPDELAAIDMFRALTSGGDAVLWRQPWRGGSGAKSTSNATRLSSVQVDLVDSANRPVIDVARIIGNRILLLRSGELVCLDAITGDVVWRRGGVPSGQSGAGRGVGTAVVADADAMMAVASDGRTLAVSAWDGSRRESDPWPEERRVWTTAGGNVLWESDGPEGGVRVGLTRAATREELLERTVSRKAAGGLVENSLAMMLDEDGTGAVWDIVAGREVAEFDLTLPGPLNRLHGMRWGESLLVLPECDWNPAEENIQAATSGSEGVLTVAGPIQAIDLEAGAAVWEEPLVVEPFGCPIDQPTGSPMMVLSRRERRQQGGGYGVQNSLTLLGIDVRDGSILTRREGLMLRYGPSLWPRVQIAPEELRSTVSLGQNQISFQWTDEPPRSEGEDQEGTDDADGTPEPEPEPEPEPFGLFEPPAKPDREPVE